jgi:hypothetical protein
VGAIRSKTKFKIPRYVKTRNREISVTNRVLVSTIDTFRIRFSDLAASRANVGLDRADPRCVRLRSYVLQRKAAVVVSNRLCFRNEHTAIRPGSLFCRMTMQITSALHTKSLFDNMNQCLSVADPLPHSQRPSFEDDPVAWATERSAQIRNVRTTAFRILRTAWTLISDTVSNYSFRSLSQRFSAVKMFGGDTICLCRSSDGSLHRVYHLFSGFRQFHFHSASELPSRTAFQVQTDQLRDFTSRNESPQDLTVWQEGCYG